MYIGIRTSCHRPDSRKQLLRVKRLGKIIIPYSPINRKRTLIPDFSNTKVLSSYRVINKMCIRDRNQET